MSVGCGETIGLADIADAAAAALSAEAARLDLEQAVAGLDALDELRLHPVIADGLRAAGYGAFAEQRYPEGRGRRRASEGERCDLVLTPGGRELSAPDRPPTLFDPPDAVPLDEAFWLEIKVVAQCLPGGPNAGYASQLLSAAREDVAKLGRSPLIRHAALLIVLFAADEATADHDLGVWATRCLDRGLPVGAPALRRFALNDRLGNRHCTVAVYPVRR